MNCPVDDVEMKLIPAGVSKTSGKKYNAFYSCPECKNTMNADVQVATTTHKDSIHKPVSNGDERAKTMVLAYAKDLVVAMMTTGATPVNPTETVLEIYRKFMEEIK